MKRHFQQEKDGHCAEATGVTAQVASALAMLAVCYAFTPDFAKAGEILLSSACSFVQNGFDIRETVPGTITIHDTAVGQVCRQSVGGITARAPSLDAGLCDQVPQSSHASRNAPESAKIPMMASLPTTDRHWCMAKAFNAALDRDNAHVVMRQTPAVVIR